MTNLSKWRLVALFFAIIAFACNNEEKNPESSTEAAHKQDSAAISKTRNNYVSAWKAGNADLLSNIYTDDAVVLYPNQPALIGKTEILSYFRDFFNQFVQDSFNLSSQEVEIVGTWAFDRGAYKWKGIPRNGGDPIVDNGKYLVILQRQSDSSWKVARDMDNSDRPLSQTTRGNN